MKRKWIIFISCSLGALSCYATEEIFFADSGERNLKAHMIRGPVAGEKRARFARRETSQHLHSEPSPLAVRSLASSSPSVEEHFPEEPAPEESLPRETAAQNEAVPETVNPESREPELIFHPRFGYGAKYVSLKQSGAFGGGEGSGISASHFHLETKLSYGRWNLVAAWEKFFLDLSRDLAAPSLRERKDFKKISLKPGYGAFFAGVAAGSTPVMQVTGTTISWADLNTVSALAGWRWEKEFAGRRKKPFTLGLELEGAYVLSADGEGATIDSGRGFAILAKARAQKAFLRREDLELLFGLEVSGAYERLKMNGRWNGASGESVRTIMGGGTQAYVGIRF